MAINNKCLIEATQLGTSASSLYQVNVNITAIIKKLTITNTSAGAVTVTIYLVPSGNTPSTSNMVTDAIAIAAGKTYEAYECEGHVLQTGDSIQAFSSAATSLSIRASGIEVV